MSNVIAFPHRLGQEAELRHADGTEQALAEAGIDPVLRAALLGTDQRKLETLIGAHTNVCAMVAPSRKEDDEEDDEDDYEDEDDEDEDENEEEDEDDFEDDEDDEDYEEDEDDYDEEEEDSLIPRRSPARRAG